MYKFVNFSLNNSINNWGNDPSRIENGKKVDENFLYSSDTNTEWMEIKTLKKWIQTNLNEIKNI